jgi:hypothetical protein
MSKPSNLRCALCNDALCVSEAEFFPYCVPCASENPKASLEVALGMSADRQVHELEWMAEFERKGRTRNKFSTGLCDPADWEDEDEQGD